jgi:DNA-binding CsgD family transcriptional regulator
MVRLSSAVLMRVQRFLLEIHAAGDVETLRGLIPEGMSRLISCDRAAFNEIDIGRERTIVPSPVPAYWDRLAPVFVMHLQEHSLGKLTDFPEPHKAVAFGDRRNDPAWMKSVLYHEYYLPIGAKHQLGTHLFQQGTVRFLLNCNRWNRDFSAEDRALLELISPHVECAWRNVSELSQLRRVQSMGDGATDEREHTVVVDADTWRITALSSAASDALRDLFGVDGREGDALPEELKRWLAHQRAVLASPAALDRPPLSFRIDRGAGSIDIRLAQTNSTTAIIFLKERRASVPRPRSPEHLGFGLTRRETEVLDWIGEGKRNSEIAIILGVSPRTVGKHVEHVLEKLGVETRTSAARYCLEAPDPTSARVSAR